jgi:hypothetical protein
MATRIQRAGQVNGGRRRPRERVRAMAIRQRTARAWPFGGLRVRRAAMLAGGILIGTACWGATAGAATAATASFTTPGGDVFFVPAGVTRVSLTVVGAAGGGSSGTDFGGTGTSAGGTSPPPACSFSCSFGSPVPLEVPVHPGDLLLVEVGGVGAGGGDQQTHAAGGFGGGGLGGAGSQAGGGGGGASLVKNETTHALLAVAGGGGGAGYGGNGGGGHSGGDQDPGSVAPFGTCNVSLHGPLSCAAGGEAGTQTAGGAGGAGAGGGGAGYPGQFGFGDAGAGGPGGNGTIPGGGGGGGYYGGGGGGAGSSGVFGNGGGSGSTYVAPSALTGGSPEPTDAPAQVLITYSTPTSLTVPLPDNRFSITRVRTTPQGRVSFRLRLPGPGIADVLETAWLNNLARDAVVLQPAPRRFVFARKHLRVSRAGTVSVTVTPNTRGKRLVARHRYPILIRLWVSYTPTGGTQRDIGLYGVRITHPNAAASSSPKGRS